MSEETLSAVISSWDSVVRSWTDGRHNVLQTENNLNVLKSALAQAIQKGIPPSKAAWSKIVADESAAGHLELNSKQAAPVAAPQAPPTPVDPRKNIPHQDIFKGINTVEKGVEFVRTYITPNAHLTKLNELLNYLKAHNIRGKGDFPIPTNAVRRDGAKDDAAIKGHTKSTAPIDYNNSNHMSDIGKSSPIRGRDKSLTDAEKSTAFGQANALLAGLTKADVGSVGTEANRGLYDAASKLKSFIRRVAAKTLGMKNRGASGEQILAYTQGEIAKLRSASVR